MKPPLLFSLFTLTLPLVMHAQEPVFDIPRIVNIAPAKQIADELLRGDPLMGEGFHVSTLASDSGEAGLAQFSLGWNEKGLLVHVVVMESNPLVEAEDDKKLADKDSVEIFFGAKKGSGQYYQLTTGTGMKAAKDPKMRFYVDDLCKPAPEQKPAPEVKSGEFEKGSTFANVLTGYDLDVLLPWSDLGITPKAGEEATFQLCVNSVDAAGRKSTVTWHPGYRAHQDPDAVYRIRLAEKASPPVRLAVRATLDHGRPRVDVVAPYDLAGKSAVLKEKEKT